MTEEINFDLLHLPIPAVVKTFSIEKQQQIFDYLNEMDDQNKKAYNIAYNHLGTSFSIDRSNGFKTWLKIK